MAAQKGKDLLIKILTSAPGVAKAYETVAGLRAHTISLNANMIDVSHASQGHGWRELLDGGGLKVMRVSGDGVFRDAVADEKVRAAFIAGSVLEWQVHIPGFYDVTGKFQVTNLEYAGQYDGEVTWSLSLESAGELSWEVSSDG